jgi:hypothetical protein
MTTHYDETDETEIAELLVGRRIVAAEKGSFEHPGLIRKSRYGQGYLEGRRADGRLTLDDGTALYLFGNRGCGGCISGMYPLEKIAAVDNIITSARVESDPGEGENPDDEDDYRQGGYRIFVVADAVEINVAEFVGSDGNGYYGTGFELHVVRAGVGA